MISEFNLNKHWITPESEPAAPSLLFPDDSDPASVALDNATRGDPFHCDPASERGAKWEPLSPNKSDPNPESEDGRMQANHKLLQDSIVCPTGRIRNIPCIHL